MSREVLAPPLQGMEGDRNYRVNLVSEDFAGNSPAHQRQQQFTNNDQGVGGAGGGDGAGYVEPDLYAEDDDEDEEDAATYTLEELPNSMFKLSMHIAQAFHGGIIGHKGSTKRRIESETRTEITVPSRHRGRGKMEDIIIQGKSRSSVCAARRKIKLLIVSLRKRLRPTHFLAVGLNAGEIRENFIKFKEEVLAADLPGIDEDLFQGDACIHLTLNVCVLLDDAERAKAVEMLQSCSQFLKDLKTPIEVKISKLEIMNDDPSAVRVLYACVESPDLQKFANSVYRLFIDSGLSQKEHGRDDVKLHMTLMNMRYKKEGSPDGNGKVARKFDAREILKRWNDFNFGTAQCTEVVLCIMGTKEEGSFYKTSGTLKLCGEA